MPFLPSDLSNLHIWYRAASESYADNDAVGTVTDRSGNGYDATQATAGNKPTFKTGIINGKAVYRFATNDSVALAAAFAGVTAAEMFAVLSVTSEASNQSIWRFGTSVSGDYFPFSDGNIYDGFGSTVRKSTGNPTVVLTSPVIYNVTTKSGEWTSRINGTQHYTTATNTVGWRVTPTIGLNADGGYLVGGDMAEFVFVDTSAGDLSSGDRASVTDYLVSEYFTAPTTALAGKVRV